MLAAAVAACWMSAVFAAAGVATTLTLTAEPRERWLGVTTIVIAVALGVFGLWQVGMHE